MNVPQEPGINPDPLAALRPNYLRRLAVRQEDVARAAHDSAARVLREDERREIHRMVHSMGSSAAIYGYTGLSEAARAAERQFEDAETPSDVLAASLTRVAQEARTVLDKS